MNEAVKVELIINTLKKNVLDYKENEYSIFANNENFTLADLFIRQYLNNGCDGFDLKNVEEMYFFLAEHKEILIEHHLISKNGGNNSGFSLWKNYNFEM